jgi:hypothetical protein
MASGNICPVCGNPDLHEPAYNDHKEASFEICPCCGVEFGYDDSGAPHRELRMRWIEGGMKWWSASRKPPDLWSPTDQLKAAGLLE